MKIINGISRVKRFLYDKNYRSKYLLERFNIRYAPELKPFPKMVLIDTTTRCNLSCNHCPSSVLSTDKNWIGDMEVSLYKKIITEIANENIETIVRPFDGGEPLMRKDIHDLIRFAKDNDIRYVSINTNGTLLTPKRIENLLKSGLDHIEVSVDAFSRETFKVIKNVDYYDKVIENIKNLIKLKKQLRPELQISLSYVKQKRNVHEVEQFIHFWQGKVDRLNIREYHQHGNLIDDHGKYREVYSKYRHPCPYLWNRAIIHHNGDVRFCENDWKAEHTLGNIKKYSLKKIWHSGDYQKIRKSHIDGTFDHPFCRDCIDWKVIA